MRLDEKLDADAGAYFDNATLIESVTTKFQTIEVWNTPALGKLMRIDGVNMTSERDEFFYHEALVHVAATTHPAPKNVLIIGGGDGGAAEEILKHVGVEKVTLCELDGGVIALAKRHFADIHKNCFADSRLRVLIGDGLLFVRETSERFDLIYLDLTDPIGAAEALYTEQFYADAKAALAPNGALVLHLGAPFVHPARVAASLAALRAVFRITAPYFVHVPSYGALWGFACASDTLDPRKLTADEVDARLAARAVQDRQLYEGATHVAMLALPPFVRAVVGIAPPTIDFT